LQSKKEEMSSTLNYSFLIIRFLDAETISFYHLFFARLLTTHHLPIEIADANSLSSKN
jgi:hypothetical protein